jgi:hypothetical protein
LNINIIHLEKRPVRLESLIKELKGEAVERYTLWSGIVDHDNTARGISRAHKQIVHFAKDKYLSEILIAEYDIHFTAPGAISFFHESKPQDFDLYLGGIYYGNISQDSIADDFAGLTLYLVHARFYDLFLSTDDSRDLDRFLAGKGKFLVCDPFVVTQHDGHSDHAGEHKSYGTYLNGRKLYGK